MSRISDITKIINNICNRDSINAYSDKKIRNIPNGINLKDAIRYRFSYAAKGSTKQSIVSECNDNNKTCFSRQAFEAKESNIPVKMYQLLLQNIITFFNTHIQKSKTDICLVGVDGTYNLDVKHKINLNIGLFDISNGIPIDITSFGNNNRNREVAVFIETIKANPDKYKNAIFVCDRLYFNYNLLYFLNSNNFKFVIRVKASQTDLLCQNPLKKEHLNINYLIL